MRRNSINQQFNFAASVEISYLETGMLNFKSSKREK